MALWLAHHVGRESGMMHYRTQPLPARPARGKETHELACNICGQAINVTIADEHTRFTRRALKLIFGVLFGLIGVVMAYQTANTPSDPVTFEQPGYVVWAVWGWVAVVFVNLCFIAFGVRDTGAYLRVPGKGLFGRFAVGHRIIDR